MRRGLSLSKSGLRQAQSSSCNQITSTKLPYTRLAALQFKYLSLCPLRLRDCFPCVPSNFILYLCLLDYVYLELVR